MKAMIFAAGLGTRLRPLTDNIPKALVPLKQKPLLQHSIDFLKDAGVDEIIVNVHHFAGKVERFIRETDFGINIEVSDERDRLLDTGGGLKKASWFFDGDEPFVLLNTDILTNLDLRTMLDYHKNQQALVTLAVRNEYRDRHLLLDRKMQLMGKGADSRNLKELVRSEEEVAKYRFSGIHILSPGVFDFLPEEDRFPILKWYLELAKNHPVKGFDHSSDFWMDLGKPENLAAAEAIFDKVFS
jgi:NDP-sugar pyrophosphorylase family protein